ncbi:MAG TPA: alkaline phosphatase family protein, partial [Acidobacteria bacterium]|nr:alkaline phosphatase family protein [Acidobacteriota bacterium]
MPRTNHIEKRQHRLYFFAFCLIFVLTSGTPSDTAQRASTVRIQTPNGTAGYNHPSIETRPYVVLLSFDGFRPDYLDRFNTPHFDRLATTGISAKKFVSVFPSLTFPAHYSIATGMYPQAHGIVGNRFFDPDRDEHFSYRDRATVQDGSWWQGEPIWVTAETQGMVTGAFFFPGTETAIRGIRPTYWKPYDGQVPNRDRIQQVLAWLSLPVHQRPHLVTLYFSLVDSAGHNIGPESPEMQHSV